MTKNQSIEPKISFIVPVYNVAKYLKACVESILNQTYSDIEVILVDDGSTDGSSMICDSFRMKDGRVQVIHQSNMGLSGARNTGLDNVKGDYVIFVDSDDVVDVNLADRCMSIIDTRGVSVVGFKHVNMSEDGSKTWKYKESNLFPCNTMLSPHDALEELIAQRVHHYAPMRCVSTELYKEMQFKFPLGRVMEDMATTYAVFGSSEGVFFLNEELYFYRQRGMGAITHEWGWKNSVDANEALTGLVEYVESRYPDLEKPACDYAVKFLIWCWMKLSASRDSFIDSDNDHKLKGWIHWFADVGNVKLRSTNRIKMFLLDSNLLRFISHLAR